MANKYCQYTNEDGFAALIGRYCLIARTPAAWVGTVGDYSESFMGGHLVINNLAVYVFYDFLFIKKTNPFDFFNLIGIFMS